MHKGQLILIPTPLNEELGFEVSTTELISKELKNNSVLILVESHKIARRRWIASQLDRNYIDGFLVFNKKTEDELVEEVIKKLKNGFTVLLISDSGMPAFCDPGVILVRACHENNIKVSSAPIQNSIIQTICLSGFKMDQFYFAGFPPQRGGERLGFLREVLKREEAIILMDTPYRLTGLIKDIDELQTTRKLFLSIDLNLETEENFLGQSAKILNQIDGLKAEFILIIEPKNNQ